MCTAVRDHVDCFKL